MARVIVHARWLDFGLRPRVGSQGGVGLTGEKEPFAVTSGAMTREEWDDARARVARGELARLERRTEREGLDGATTAQDAASRLAVSPRSLAYFSGDLFAFVIDGKLRYPTWQFTGDRDKPVIPDLAQLVRAFDDDMHPSSIAGFMNTRQQDAYLDGVQLTPVEWLLRGGNVELLVDILGGFLMS